MKSKCWLSVTIVAVWLLGSACRAQDSGYTQPTNEQPVFPAPAPLGEQGLPAPSAAPLVQETGGLSDWIVFHRDCCEGKPGRIMPFFTELYMEAGPTVPVGGMTMSRELKTGFSIAGGARALFFNEPMTSAWVVDAHLMDTNESAGRRNSSFPVTIYPGGMPVNQPTATLEDWNRVAVGLGLGHDWFPWKSADPDGCQWRLGFDAGGRYGTSRVDFDEKGRLTGVCETIYAGAHNDLEIPCGRLVWHVGVRAEWNYTWSNVLQRSSDIQELSFFLNIGARY